MTADREKDDTIPYSQIKGRLQELRRLLADLKEGKVKPGTGPHLKHDDATAAQMKCVKEEIAELEAIEKRNA
jgi:hypothetical protein